MKYCPICRTEFVDTVDECSDCKCPLVTDEEWNESLAREQRSREALRDEDMESACTVGGPIEAQSLMAALDQDGIPALLRSYEETAFDGLFIGSKGWGQIWVASSRLEEAKALIQALRSSPTPKIPGDDIE